MPVQIVTSSWNCEIMEDIGRIFEDKPQMAGTGHFTEKHWRSRKQRLIKSMRGADWSMGYNVTTVDELVGLLSQEGQTQTHHSTRQISRQTGLTQSSITRIIHCDAHLKRLFHSPKSLFWITVSFSYIWISQGSVETQLRCARIFNNRIIANLLHSTPVKNCFKIC